MNPGHTRGATECQQQRETLKQTRMEDKMSSPHTGLRKMGWRCGLRSAGGGGGKRGSEQVSHPHGKGRHHTKRISGEFWKEIFGKLGELGTDDTYPIGSHIRYVLQLPNHCAHRMPGLCCWLSVPILRAGRVRASWSPVWLPRPLENIGAIPHKKAENARSSMAGLFILSTAVSPGLEPPGP